MYRHYLRRMQDVCSPFYMDKRRYPDRVSLGFMAMREWCAVAKLAA